MPSAYEVVGLVLSILGIGIITLVVNSILGLLPTSQLQYFDRIVFETEGLLQTLSEDKIFSDANTILCFQQRLRTLRDKAEPLRWSTYCSTTNKQQLAGLFNGLSRNLSRLCREAVRLRAEISTTATSEREALQRDDYVVDKTHEDDRSPSCDLTHDVDSRSSLDTMDVTKHSDDTHKILLPSTFSPPTAGLHTKKRPHSQQFLRRSRRVLYTRFELSRPVAQMEFSKCGVIRSADFRRIARGRTVDSTASSATCVADTDSSSCSDFLPLYVKPSQAAIASSIPNTGTENTLCEESVPHDNSGPRHPRRPRWLTWPLRLPSVVGSRRV
ncbi:hypothetical protein C8Q80DRAFT_331501 [Daedaleopsis nitida]|nr:hypothetical protein C8Q80DRAFT_331501 [Daedaleopsis nitida]